MSTVDDLREIALSLPEATERPAWDMPAFRVRDKIFAAVSATHGVGIPISKEERAELVSSDPDKFYWTAHDQNYGFMRLRLENIEPDELRELLTDAWRRKAGPRLSKSHDI